MTSCDTNILFAACNLGSAEHVPARKFLLGQATSSRFVVCEQVLMESYCLLRKPAVSKPPLSARDAVMIIERFRSNPHWRVVDVPAFRGVMDRVWDSAGRGDFAFRKIFDLRLALTLRHHGVTHFATRNLKDFSDCGFTRVFDPCADSDS